MSIKDVGNEESLLADVATILVRIKTNWTDKRMPVIRDGLATFV